MINRGTDSPTENSTTIRISIVKDKDVTGKKTNTILSWAKPKATLAGQFMEKPSLKLCEQIKVEFSSREIWRAVEPIH